MGGEDGDIPLKVGTNSVHFALIEGDASHFHEGSLGVIHLRGSIAVGIVGNLVIIPDRDPRELLVTCDEVEIGAVGSNSLAVVVECCNFLVGKRDTANCLSPTVVAVLVLVNVVTEVDNVVNRVLR